MKEKGGKVIYFCVRLSPPPPFTKQSEKTADQSVAQSKAMTMAFQSGAKRLPLKVHKRLSYPPAFRNRVNRVPAKAGLSHTAPPPLAAHKSGLNVFQRDLAAHSRAHSYLPPPRHAKQTV